MGYSNGNGRREVMKKNFLISLLIICGGLVGHAQYTTTIHRIYSPGVKDSFDIYTSLPKDYSTSKKYDLIIYCDANLKSGKELRRQIEPGIKSAAGRNYIFIGVGHIGNYHELRRRDFILPFINGNDTVPKSVGYGHIADFYHFLTTDLIPSAEKSYSCSSKRTILGHSLGGLFAFYCLFQNDTVFTNYIALSPALWIDGYSIYHFNRINKGMNKKAFLYMSAGSKETINRILTGTNSMNEFLKAKDYKHLSIEYQVHKGKTHNTQVPESIKYVLQHF
jgi:predicted alpha/beta superfamily hydrolase